MVVGKWSGQTKFMPTVFLPSIRRLIRAQCPLSVHLVSVPTPMLTHASTYTHAQGPTEAADANAPEASQLARAAVELSLVDSFSSNRGQQFELC